MVLLHHYVFCLIILIIKTSDVFIKANHLSLNFYNMDIEEFVRQIQNIPTWEKNKIRFSSDELKQIVPLINSNKIHKVPELDRKFDSKQIALKCIYSYITQIISMNLDMFPYTIVTDSRANHVKETNTKKSITFSNKISVILYDENDPCDSISRITKRGSRNLIDISEGTFRTQNIHNIMGPLARNKEYVINMFKLKDFRFNISDDYVKYVEMYRSALARMISVIIMAQDIPSNWLWSYFLNLNALETGEINLGEFYNNTTDDVISCNKFVLSCKECKYLYNLEPNKVNNEDDLKKNVNKSVLLLEKIKLMSDKNENLLPLFKYENSVRVYDYLLKRKIHRIDFLPLINNINFRPINEILYQYYEESLKEWKTNPYLIVKYYDVLSDVLKIALLYYTARHVTNYLIIMESVNERPRGNKFTKEKIRNDIYYYFEKPSVIIKSMLRYMDILNDPFYSNITKIFVDYKVKEVRVFYKLIDKLFLELEELLKKYGTFDPILHQKSKEGDIKLNIYTNVRNECYDQLSDYYQTYISKLGIINFRVINYFKESEFNKWFE
ncbi:uncharacterized protein LOC126895052 [Daktulosphaira vitifoliae]|uniref:uncharacterized protein LOC126895052 n=1 Tax=Daktulosphaira vitifoliae TaxID=58002 RepID=UPI0021A9CD0A|nr:uncharacterized protein LOC126895052 [Daktulosphaira vitifoliae]